MKSIFENWKSRTHSLGHLMTNLPSKEDKEKLQKEIKVLEDERDTGINSNGNKVQWTPNKKIKLIELKAKLNAPDQLPEGAKTHLDHIFNTYKWRRNRILHNKYLEKGNLMEEDALQAVSDYDSFLQGKKVFYVKNKELLHNQYLQGTPDNKQDIIRDTKANWDKDSFDKVELTSIYAWQIKGYCWMDGKTEGELCYTLVNAAEHQVIKAKKDCYFVMGCPDEDNEEYLEELKQIERNMIFDVPAFKKSNPNYLFENDYDFSIPLVLRVKKFTVNFDPIEDSKNIISRILLSRKYLMDKEREENEKIERWKQYVSLRN